MTDQERLAQLEQAGKIFDECHAKFVEGWKLHNAACGFTKEGCGLNIVMIANFAEAAGLTHADLMLVGYAMIRKEEKIKAFNSLLQTLRETLEDAAKPKTEQPK